ncbi:MAG: hypothetical protein M0T84_00170 [Betaproteobacteria bacterium]|nr:hypothetical protein [Betaproteobacteria bacterium]
MTKCKIVIRAEADRLLDVLREIEGLRKGASFLGAGCLLSAELSDLLAQPVLDTSKFVRVDSLPAANGAGDVLVSFQPSDLLLELLSALRARNLDRGVIEIEGHGGSSQ